MMHIVVTKIPLTRPLTSDEVERIERELPPLVGDTPGFHGFYWAQTAGTEALTVSLWDSPDAADTVFARVRPWLGAILGSILAGAPERHVGEVLVAHRADVSG